MAYRTYVLRLISARPNSTSITDDTNAAAVTTIEAEV